MELLTKSPPYVSRPRRDEDHDTAIARQAVHEAFNAVPIGMIITDENARILQLNRTAEDLVLHGRGLVIHNGALSAKTSSDAACLRQTISDVVAKARHGRGAKARAITRGRYHVSFEDVRALAHPVLRHRVLTNFPAESEGVTVEKVIDMLLDKVLEPASGLS